MTINENITNQEINAEAMDNVNDALSYLTSISNFCGKTFEDSIM